MIGIALFLKAEDFRVEFFAAWHFAFETHGLIPANNVAPDIGRLAPICERTFRLCNLRMTLAHSVLASMVRGEENTMYELDLKEAYCPAQTDTEYKERTVDAMLREQVGERGPMQLALARTSWPTDRWGANGPMLSCCTDAERCGRALASRHKQGARIAIMGGNCPEWVLIQYGRGGWPGW